MVAEASHKFFCAFASVLIVSSKKQVYSKQIPGNVRSLAHYSNFLLNQQMQVLLPLKSSPDFTLIIFTATAEHEAEPGGTFPFLIREKITRTSFVIADEFSG